MGEGTITIEGFRPFCQSHTMLLLPLLTVQGKLRTAAMGATFWENMSSRKLELKKGHSVALRDLLVQVDKHVPCSASLCWHLLLQFSSSTIDSLRTATCSTTCCSTGATTKG